MRWKVRIILITIILLFACASNVIPAFGVYWLPQTLRLTTTSDFDREASVTQTKDGKVWVVWPRSVYGNDTILCRISSDLGKTWSREDNLTAYEDASRKASPTIFQTRDSAIWLVWSSDKQPPPPTFPHFTLDANPDALTIPKGGADTSTIQITSVNDFSEPVNLTTSLEPLGVNTDLNPAQVTPPPNGIAYSTLTISVDQSATPGNYQFKVIGKSSSYSDNVSITLNITESSSLSSTSEYSSGKYSSYTQSNTETDESDYEIYYKTSNDNGETWSNAINLTDNAYNDQTPSLLHAQNGVIWLVWCSEQSGNPDIFYKTSSDGGATWSSATQLTTDTARDRSPSITQTKSGKIWVAWSSDRLGNNDIFYKIYDGSWSSDTHLPTDTDNDTSPKIRQTFDRKMWIFWSKRVDTPSGTGDIYYKYSKDHGTSWSASIQFTTDAAEDVWPAITQSSDHKMWVVWTSNRADQPDGNWDIYCKTSLVGDINEDGIVSIMDLVIVAISYMAQEGQPNYDMDLDLYGDGIIDIRDLSIIGRNYGSTG